MISPGTSHALIGRHTEMKNKEMHLGGRNLNSKGRQAVQHNETDEFEETEECFSCRNYSCNEITKKHFNCDMPMVFMLPNLVAIL